MKRKAFTAIALFVIAAIVGFGFIEKNKIEDPTKSTAPVVQSNLDNLIVGAKYNPNSVNAIWSESFDGATFPPTGWLKNQESGTATWNRVTAGTYPVCATHSGAGMIGFNSFSASTGTCSLVSAVFSLTSGPATLGFWMYRDAGYAGTADLVNYMINTTASSTGATLLGTINRNKSMPPAETGADGWYYYEFTIPGTFNTATNYIVLQATSAYGNDIYVDDVAVTANLAHDVGMVSVDIASPVMPGVIAPKATVKNYGSGAETFPVTMTITPGGYTNTQNVTALAAGASIQATFANWTPTIGTYSVKVITQLGTDLNRTNDTLLKSITVTSSTWTLVTAISSGSYMGCASSYMRNDTGWVVCTGGNAPNLNSTLIYNVRTNAWTTGTAMTNGNLVHASATLKDTVYVLGGYGTGTAPVTNFDKYNMRAATWTAGTPLPTAIGFSNAVGYQDSIIYLAGGYNGTAVVATVQLYNSNTNTWRAATPLPATRFGGAFARTGDTLVYVGGGDLSVIYGTTYVGVISQTDRSVITWTTKTAYPAGAMYRFNGGSWKPGQIIVGGGSPSSAWTPATPGPAYVYTVSTDTWTALPNLTTPVLGAYTGAVKWTNTYKFVIASGYSGTAAVTDVQIYSDVITGIRNISQEVPKDYSLMQNYPNPFNPSTSIKFAIPSTGLVTLKVYDILGKEIATLLNETKSAGTYLVDFNASKLSSGIYFYKLDVNGFSSIKKMSLIK